MNKKIFNILGCSGSGKTALVNKVLTDLKEVRIEKIVTDTSRKIRDYDNEVEGVDYYFKDKDQMLALLSDDCYFEINDKYTQGTLYGIRKEEIFTKLQNSSDGLIIITDINGTNRLKDAFNENVVTIYIDVAEDLIKSRMISRGDSKTTIEERLQKNMKDCNVNLKNQCKYVIENDDFLESYNKLKKIIIENI